MTSRRLGHGVYVLAALVLAVLATAGTTSGPAPVDTEMTVKGRATVRGRVTLDGPAPDLTAMNRDFLAGRSRHADRAVCLKGPKEENEQQTWRIGDGGAVANVVVWLRPADGSHFEMTKEDLHPKKRTWADEVVVGQPYLNYTPRVLVLFPSYFDPVKKKQVATGQVFKVENDTPVACDVSWHGGADNPGEHHIMPAKGAVKPELTPARMPVVFQSSIHPWMQGYAWVFDHPYAAVIDRTGRYEIRKVPAGVALRLIAWHEEVGYLYGRDGIAVELKDGDNRKDLRVRAGE